MITWLDKWDTVFPLQKGIITPSTLQAGISKQVCTGEKESVKPEEMEKNTLHTLGHKLRQYIAIKG